MFEYTDKELSATDCDALVLEVNSVGSFSSAYSQVLQRELPDVIPVYRKEFSAGNVEPGRLLYLHRPQHNPQHVFLLPTRIHAQGEVQAEPIKRGTEDLMERLLELGIKSIAFPIIAPDRGIDAGKIKLLILTAFAKVPKIRLVFHPSPDGGQKPTQISMFTDGGADQSSGKGGYGVVLRCGKRVHELSAGFQSTSSDRMELFAAIAGLEALNKRCHVRLHSDSSYVVNAVNDGFIFRRQAEQWKKKKTRNVDLWQRFLRAYLRHEVEMVWVKGHAGINDNERCDQLATAALHGESLGEDSGFAHQHVAAKSRLAPVRGPSGAVSSDLSQAAAGTKPRGPKPKKAGDPCRSCQQPLIRRNAKKPKSNSVAYHAWYLFCEQCHRTFYVAEARVSQV